MSARSRGGIRSLEVVILVSLLFPSIVAGLPQRPSSEHEALDLDLFLAKPRVREVALSGDGLSVAVLLRESFGASLRILDNHTGSRVQEFQARFIESVFWSSDSRVVFLETQSRIGFWEVGAERPSWFLELDSDLETRFLGVDPVLPRHVLLSEHPAADLYFLVRVGTDGQRQVLRESAEPIRSFLLDGKGDVSFLKTTEGLEQIILDVRESVPVEVLRCSATDACQPLSQQGENGLFVKGRFDGDLWTLSVLDLERGVNHRVHQDPEGLADLASVVFDSSGTVPLLATYDSDRRRVYGLSETTVGHLQRLRDLLPEAEIRVESEITGPFWLIAESGPRIQHPRYLIYRTSDGTVRRLLTEEREQVESLPELELVTQEPVSYQASDGVLIHGFLSVPRGVELSRTPVVVRVHGGPWDHVRSGFNTLTQFLVSRGYIVFQPNFRSSTGFGMRFLTAGRGEFGEGQVHQDLIDGLDWLLKQRIGDSERVAILGHSFGGFAALGAVSFAPERFVVGVASSPPIDLVRAVRDMDPLETTSGGIPKQLAVSELLVDMSNPKAVSELVSRSPEANAERTARPLLIFAGGQDPKVEVADVKHYAATLADLGKDVSLLVDEERGHGFDTEISYRAYLYLVEQYLGQALGGVRSSTKDPLLVDYLESNLLLVGPTLQSTKVVRMPQM